MGLTQVTVAIQNLSKTGDAYESLFLVDTGAIDCLAPASELKKIGVEREGKDVYELADGTTIEMSFGFCRLSFMGFETVSKITFGAEETEPILGVTALESIGIMVDPVSQTLKKRPAMSLK